MLDPEQLAKGRALIEKRLGGSSPHAALESLVAAVAEAFALDRRDAAGAWPDYVTAALAQVDSALERGAESENRYRAESLRANGLESELTEARASLAEWKAEAVAANRLAEERGVRASREARHAARFQAVAVAVGQTPIGELPDRIRQAFSKCSDEGARINHEESGND